MLEALGDTAPEAGAEAGLTGRLQEVVVAPLWAELDALLRTRLGALTLDELLKRAAAAGLKRAAGAPLNFAI